MFSVVLDEPKIGKSQGDPVYRRLTQGNNATFRCPVESGHPKPEITWYFGWADTLKKVDPVYDARFTHPTDETWLITGIETQDQGKYRCIAENKAGKDELRFDITHVDGKLLHVKLNYNVHEVIICYNLL